MQNSVIGARRYAIYITSAHKKSFVYSKYAITSTCTHASKHTHPCEYAHKHATIHTHIHGLHTSSFGIVMYELFHCRIPFGDAGCYSAEQVGQAVLEKGLRPQINPKCPTMIAALMKDCWQADPSARPNFEQVGRDFFCVFMRLCCSGLLSIIGCP
jgi:hypothetical protein